MLAAASAATRAASLALSGPAGGVAGAALVLRAAGLTRGLTIDIGGTSADAGIVLDGEPLVEAGGSVAGVPIALPRVLVETVSAGGGSIGWVDDGGALRVGPRSAGAVPGPVAFGRGGTEPTLTDAHLALGNIRADRMRADMPLDRDGATRAITALASALGVPAERCARAMIATADAAMARALRRVSVERGIDPRDCALVAFGGAGPLHACGLAEALGMHRVLVPPFAGVLSALGLAVAPERRTGLASVMRPATEEGMHALREAAALADRRTGASGQGEPRWVARMRYLGQGHELEVPFDPSTSPRALAESFAALHAQRYRFVLDAEVEIVSTRCTRSSPGPSLTLGHRQPRHALHGAADDEGSRDVAPVAGPAVVALPDATMLVADGWTARALEIGGWMLERS
jgi:N-methylhydantoinase A/oxoprolinase/acetone carboxylase beta subunit